MIDYDKISIWDGAPIKNIVSPDEEPKFDAVDGQVQQTHRKYSQQTELYFDDPSMNHKSEAWQLSPEEAPSNTDGPIQGEIQEWIEERIKWHTGSDNILHLRSWWSILNKDVQVPKHSHTYQTRKRTVSGIMWTKGDICPLYVQGPQDTIPDLINNVPGRLVIFSNNTNHWTDPYPHMTTRTGISFDYMIQDQDLCECVDEGVCHRCMHLTENLRKLGIKNLYSGGSTTVKYETESGVLEGASPGETINPEIIRRVKTSLTIKDKDGNLIEVPSIPK